MRSRLPWIILLLLVGCSNASGPAEGSLQSLINFSHKGIAPSHDSLHPLFPNPFNRAGGDTTIKIYFDLDSTSSSIHLLVQNALGDEIAGFTDSLLAPGYYSGEWNPIASNGTPLNAGLYFITLRANNFIYSRLVNIEENE